MPTRSLAAAVAFTALFSACQQSPDSAETGTAVLDALEQVRDQHVDAVVEQNLEEGLATYTDSAVVVPPGHEGAVGSQEIRAWMQAFHDNFTVEQLEISMSEPVIRGDLAVAHYRYSWRVAPAGASEAVPDTGQGLWVFERQPDGSWLIAYDIWNSDGGAANIEQ